MLTARNETTQGEKLAVLREALAIGPREVISLVGAGGKTTLMFSLARELAADGRLVVTTTTTKIMPPAREESEALFLAEDEGQLLELASGSRGRHRIITLARRRLESGKLEGVSPGTVGDLASLEGIPYVIVEADGSARRPLKAPNATEPVIPESTTMVIAVVGMGALGQPLDEAHVFRSSMAAELLGRPLGSVVGVEDIARLLTHPLGIAKGTPPRARIVPFLNQVDLDGDLEGGRAVARALLAAGHPQIRRVVMGQARGGRAMVVEGMGRLDGSGHFMRSRRSIRRAISSLQDRIHRHREKLEREPHAQAAEHWEREIRNFKSQIARLRKRLGRS